MAKKDSMLESIRGNAGGLYQGGALKRMYSPAPSEEKHEFRPVTTRRVTKKEWRSDDNFISAEDVLSLRRSTGYGWKLTTVLPDNFKTYINRRAAEAGVDKAEAQWLLVNLILKDMEKHPELTEE